LNGANRPESHDHVRPAHHPQEVIESRKSLRIALLGTRGIPAAYGGFETFAEELSSRLVERGHSVTVYARRSFFKPQPVLEYRGVEVRFLPTVMHKYLETPLHALICFLDLFRRRFDVVLLCNAANSPFAFLVRLRGLHLAINVDGIERLRTKWNSFGRAWYRLGEWCSVKFADRIVADAQVIQEYYRERFSAPSTVIAYGATVVRRDPGEALKKFGLIQRQYILYVSRLEPENNALGVIQAYNCLSSEIKSKVPLVIVGDAPYAKSYHKELHQEAGNGVIFTGFQFGSNYQELQSNCLIYVQATEVGGTHPALVEAMAYANCVVANGTPENLEVLGDAGLTYPKNDFLILSQLLLELINCSEEQRETLRRKARQRAEVKYSWSGVTIQYEELFYQLRAFS